MLIEVVVSGWEQNCCGGAFTRGHEATVSIFAADPSELERDAPARFIEEHHGQTPDDVPKKEVTGSIARITGVSYDLVRRPGPAPVFERGEKIESPGELDAVAARETAGFDELRLLLDIADDVRLPHHVVSAESLAAQDRAVREQQLADLRRTDDVGVLLAVIGDEVAEAYSSVATIERSEDGQALTLEPHRAGATGISWARYAPSDTDIIAVNIGEGHFSYSADIKHASDLRELVAATAAGRVREKVRAGDELTLLETIVESAEGRTWTATVTEKPFRPGGGIVLMAGRLAARLSGGDHGYEPWTP